MEDLLATHRKESKALQGKLTALRKEAQANKKRKKELQAEMDQLEKDLKTKHAQEIADLEAQLAATSISASSESSSPDAGADAGPSADDDIPAANSTDRGCMPSTIIDAGGLMPSQPKQKKPNRQQLRKQRKQAEIEALQAEARKEAEAMPDRAAIEAQRLKDVLARHKLKVHSIPADGHCLFNSVAHQLEHIGGVVEPHTYQSLRSLAAQSIMTNKDEFLPFLLNEETGDLMTDDDLEKYVNLIVHTPLWGGHTEIKALSMGLKRTIHVFHPSSSEPHVVGTEFAENGAPLRVCYVQHQFGLGEHYNSLVDL
ncbi:hypothetical protein BCR44DRAFT_41551 [Catenaria anguillulae PL171]|uniref:OTU domain-containing protein n=1 Tax=Catenaria anguillulae PL171 TaxID=765915 RepID=A0A1Y2HAR6_9FUNG|nr:hypothetical protein BCR44DRAFT_41551 [Catenaria anguillulae PL171]